MDDALFMSAGALTRHQIAAQEMGGSLAAHSEGLGHGATFTIELPIDAAPDPA